MPHDERPLEQINDDVLRRARHDPRVYVQLLWRHPARPEDNYDFMGPNGEKKLNYLLHDDGPLNPDSWGTINLLKFHRGGLKTTAMNMISTWAIQMYLTKGLKEYMTAPREKPPIKGFMKTFKQKTQEVGLDAYYETNNEQYQEFEVQREDEYGNTFPVRSVLEADSGYNPDTLRGPHSHIGIIDEFQDIGKEAFDTYSHCIDQELPEVEYFPVIFVIGTPKEEGSFYHQLWKQSDQKSWDAEARTWVQADEPGTYTPSEEMIENLGIGADEEIPEREVRGWHLDCYNSPLKSPAEIAQAKKNQSTRKFKNEMEAVFYDSAGSLLTDSTLEDVLFNDSRSFHRHRQFDDSTVVVGADWGGGGDDKAADTVIGVVEYVDVGDGDGGSTTEGEIRKVDFLDDSLTPQEEVRRVEEAIIQYDAELGVVDFGHGNKKFQDLQDGVGTLDEDGYQQRVKAARFGNLKNKSDLKWEQNSGQRRFFTVDKTHAYERFVDAVRSGTYTCPSSQLSFDGRRTEGQQILRHLTAPYKTFSTTIDGKKKTRIETDDNRNDDFADVLVFCHLGYHEVNSFSIEPTVGMQKRRGCR